MGEGQESGGSQVSPPVDPGWRPNLWAGLLASRYVGEPNSVGADLVERTVDVSEPVGEDGVRVAEDVTPEVEGE